jgi:hypothetical protein
MSPFKEIVEELRSLPPGRLEVAAAFVHRLSRITDDERRAILANTAGVLTEAEAEELERVIDEGCGNVDEHNW